MSPRPRKIGLFAVIPLALASVASPPDALACGACFSPPPVSGKQTDVIVQDAERIYFHRDPATKKTTVWIEIRYSGPADNFAWVLPLPAKPTVGVGSSYLFDRLDQAMAPRFVSKWARAPMNCRQPSFSGSGGGCGFSDSPLAASEGGGTVTTTADAGSADASSGTTVKVLEKSQAGPYNYTILTSANADDLYKWLTENKYDIPPKAKDIVASHIKKGDVFVAFKLANDSGVNEIRPVTLVMDDTDPCVPMRLTSIAAVEDMAVSVYLAGPGRGAPKNHLHAHVNPMRLSWTHEGPAKNYVSVLSEAIDEASGRAFVTEAAMTPDKLQVSRPSADPQVQTVVMHEEPIDSRRGYGEGKLFADASFETKSIANAVTLNELADAVRGSSIVITNEVAGALEKHSKLHAKAAKGIGQSVREFWQEVADKGFVLPKADDAKFDGKALAAELDKEFSGPMRAVAKQLETSKMVSKLAMRISPEEMLRDPIFGFNDKLGVIDPVYQVELAWVCKRGEYPVDAVQLRHAGLKRRWIVDAERDTSTFPARNEFNFVLDPRFKSSPAALKVELLDEDGAAKPVPKAQIELVDSAIAGAELGKAQLPDGFELKKAAADDRWKVPESDADPVLQQAADELSSEAGGCNRGGGVPAGWLALVLLAVAVLGVRRYV